MNTKHRSDGDEAEGNGGWSKTNETKCVWTNEWDGGQRQDKCDSTTSKYHRPIVHWIDTLGLARNTMDATLIAFYDVRVRVLQLDFSLLYERASARVLVRTEYVYSMRLHDPKYVVHAAAAFKYVVNGQQPARNTNSEITIIIIIIMERDFRCDIPVEFGRAWVTGRTQVLLILHSFTVRPAFVWVLCLCLKSNT